jgi:hypothetical protein
MLWWMFFSSATMDARLPHTLGTKPAIVLAISQDQASINVIFWLLIVIRDWTYIGRRVRRYVVGRKKTRFSKAGDSWTKIPHGAERHRWADEVGKVRVAMGSALYLRVNARA